MMPTLKPKASIFRFPEPSMSYAFIDLYFTNMNTFFPVLHRPSFDKCFDQSLHLSDEGFASVLLLVCAIGCRFSDDPRITHRTSKTVKTPTGWQLFHQVRRLRQTILHPSIHDLQVYCVSRDNSTSSLKLILVS